MLRQLDKVLDQVRQTHGDYGRLRCCPALLSQYRQSGTHWSIRNLNQPGIWVVKLKNQENRNRNRSSGDEQTAHCSNVERRKQAKTNE